ncbi:MAG: S-adenosylmethionine:tRNA ribosyltransferase-isomerase [Bacteroidetes bacterium]|nr:S-adenosylmethionine:tRNA ribosyltransferase-isomerase [Bacteroidota bacterium]
MTDPRKISILDFSYDLPAEKIALHPLPQRDASKLLIYKDGNISEDVYRNIADHLPENSLLVFNNTRVINARLRFKKATGSIIEIFCLEPHDNVNEYSSIMNKKGSVRWKCFVGGMSKWKEKELISDNGQFILKAVVEDKLTDAYLIRFSWEPSSLSFAEVLQAAGDIPLPPYIKRTTDTADTERYQTIYAKFEGSVAAPTAGLHFTEHIFQQLQQKNIEVDYITLHVGAGTFKPVKAAHMQDHEMHAEWIDVDLNTIKHIQQQQGKIFAVGTTSARTIESLYWLGVKYKLDPSAETKSIHQWDVYDASLNDPGISVTAALDALIEMMKIRKLNRIFTQTQLLIAPGYRFKILKGLITNFHQPQSTLLLLVAAATNGEWKKIYDYALENNFRFLSYGDGNLIYL